MGFTADFVPNAVSSIKLCKRKVKCRSTGGVANSCNANPKQIVVMVTGRAWQRSKGAWRIG